MTKITKSTWERKGLTKSEYEEELAKKRGYTSFREYQEFFAKKKGFKSFSEYTYSKEKERRKIKGTPYQRAIKERDALCLLLEDIISNIPDEINEKLDLTNKLNKLTQCKISPREKQLNKVKRKTLLELIE